MIMVAMLVSAVVLVVLAVMLGLRTWVLGEAKVEAQLRDPGAHTLSYVVPEGWDPALFKAALARAHFTALAESDGRVDRLVVACDESDRNRVREVLEAVHGAGPHGPDERVAHVRFADER